NWNNDLAPRLSAAYDLFGNGRTALKGSWSRYYERLTGGFADWYAPGVQNESRNWFDCDINAAGTGCSTLVLPTNGDNIAQDNEIGPSGSANFGARADRSASPDFNRQYNWEFTVGAQQQVMPRLALGAMMYKRRVG